MMVCAHGNVTDFCKERDMIVCDTWTGDIRDYSGPCRVLVTDSDMTENEYYYRKGEMLARGVELISTKYLDSPKLLEYLVYSNDRRRVERNTRMPTTDPKVVDRIIELRAAKKSLRAIREDEGVRNPDGTKLCISTIRKRIIERENKNGK